MWDLHNKFSVLENLLIEFIVTQLIFFYPNKIIFNNF